MKLQAAIEIAKKDAEVAHSEAALWQERVSQIREREGIVDIEELMSVEKDLAIANVGPSPPLFPTSF